QVKNKLKVNYENGSDLVIWPNPSTGLVNFEINETLHSEKQTIAKVLIFDGVGKLVHVRSNMDMQRVTYNPNNIESGVYQVVVEDIYGNKYTGRMTIRKP
ncbi:MAG: Secretion system C-terminal sorting domain, partial [Bacteroidota bacterium]